MTSYRRPPTRILDLPEMGNSNAMSIKAAGGWHSLSGPGARVVVIALPDSVCILVGQANPTDVWTNCKGCSGMDPTSLRMRYLVAIFLAAVLTAGALRHIVHSYGGISREEIRAFALTAAGLGILLLIILVVRRRRQP